MARNQTTDSMLWLGRTRLNLEKLQDLWIFLTMATTYAKTTVHNLHRKGELNCLPEKAPLQKDSCWVDQIGQAIRY